VNLRFSKAVDAGLICASSRYPYCISILSFPRLRPEMVLLARVVSGTTLWAIGPQQDALPS